MKRVFLACLCTLLLFASGGYAAIPSVDCDVDLSSCIWSEDGSNWTDNSKVFSLDIICKEGDSPVSNYSAEFDILLNKGTSGSYTAIAKLKAYSTPTDANGKAKINAPLIHIPLQGGEYIHICPFDDIIYTGGEYIISQPSSSLQFLEIPRNNDNYNPQCFPWLQKGCCQTTITVKCCDPPRVFTYCSVTTQLKCAVGSIDPDPCTSIVTSWSADRICDYCTGLCTKEDVVDLVSFKAFKSFGKVTLIWETASEINNYGFNIYRAENKNGEYTKINSEIIPAQGGPTQGGSYTYEDTNVKAMKTYYYRLEDVDLDNSTTMHEPVKAMPKVLYDIFK